jgi:hypothetical protein
MSMGKGAVDPAHCFKLVDSTLAPNQKQLKVISFGDVIGCDRMVSWNIGSREGEI